MLVAEHLSLGLEWVNIYIQLRHTLRGMVIECIELVTRNGVKNHELVSFHICWSSRETTKRTWTVWMALIMGNIRATVNALELFLLRNKTKNIQNKIFFAFGMHWREAHFIISVRF